MGKYNVEGSNEAKKQQYDVEVTSAKIIALGKVKFNVKVNGVYIFDMNLIEYKNKEGKEGTMITFPSWKSETMTDENGKPKYNNYCDFPITKELKADIEAQIDSKLGK